jgi:hypothetical protein
MLTMRVQLGGAHRGSPGRGCGPSWGDPLPGRMAAFDARMLSKGGAATILLIAKRSKQMGSLVPVERIELPTFGLQNRCTTAVLHRHQDVETEAKALSLQPISCPRIHRNRAVR